MSIKLDHKSYKIVSYLAMRQDTEREVPTQQEIAEYIGLQSPGSVYIRLLKLQIAGYVDREEGVQRSIKVTDLGRRFLREPIPLGEKVIID